ncbi:MAG TPA: SlyX family protein [Burkholderiaceae bacterium]
MTDEQIDHRLTELEIKASYADDLLDHLNRLVASQQDRIDRLSGELAALRRHSPETDAPAARDPRDELPPHY